jgi:hypothetical protein
MSYWVYHVQAMGLASERVSKASEYGRDAQAGYPGERSREALLQEPTRLTALASRAVGFRSKGSFSELLWRQSNAGTERESWSLRNERFRSFSS